MHRVFTYGTLLRGEYNHRVIEPGTFIREAQTADEFLLYHLGGFPGMTVPEPSSDYAARVVGEVYDVDDETLAMLDRLEGHPDFYIRTKIELADGEEVWTYLLPSDRLRWRPEPRVIVSGDWRKAKRSI